MKTQVIEQPTAPLQERLAAAQAACDETTGQLGQTRRAAIAAALHYRDLAYCQEQGILVADDAEVGAAALVAQETQAALISMRTLAHQTVRGAQDAIDAHERERRAAWVLATYPDVAERLAEAERGMATVEADMSGHSRIYALSTQDAAHQRLAGIQGRIVELGAQAPAVG